MDSRALDIRDLDKWEQESINTIIKKTSQQQRQNKLIGLATSIIKTRDQEMKTIMQEANKIQGKQQQQILATEIQRRSPKLNMNKYQHPKNTNQAHKHKGWR